MGIQGREERDKGSEIILEAIMTGNFPKLLSDTKPQIQEAQSTPKRINAPPSNKTTPEHIIFKLQKKIKENILEKKNTGKKKGFPVKLEA